VEVLLHSCPEWEEEEVGEAEVGEAEVEAVEAVFKEQLPQTPGKTQQYKFLSKACHYKPEFRILSSISPQPARSNLTDSPGNLVSGYIQTKKPMNPRGNVQSLIVP
jgi:hypothetical protein